MNQQLAKVSQRQIRRALGHEANAMLNAHAEAMKIINQDMAAQKQAMEDVRTLVTFSAQKSLEVAQDAQACAMAVNLKFANMSLLARLKWLVFGR